MITKKSVLSITFVYLFLTIGIARAGISWELTDKLLQLPEGVTEAADVEMILDKSATDVNIPGFIKNYFSKGRVFFRKESVTKQICTLDEKAALEKADEFLNKNFPSLKGRKKLNDFGKMMVTKYVPGREKSESHIEGYSIDYFITYKSIPIIDNMIDVWIKGNEVVEIGITIHKIKEISKPLTLLDAKQCLIKGLQRMTRKIDDNLIVKDVLFGYQKKMPNFWEDRFLLDEQEQEEPEKAFCVYHFIADFEAGSMLRSLVFDARTAELLYPKAPEGKGRLIIEGTELNFSKAGSQEIFLIAPIDIDIRNAIFEFENILSGDDWIKKLEIFFGDSVNRRSVDGLSKGSFASNNLGSYLSYELRYNSPSYIKHRNIAKITISTLEEGRLILKGLEVDFVAGTQKQADEKKEQFFLVYPDATCSRQLSIDELEIFASYIRGLIDSAEERQFCPFKLIKYSGLVRKISTKFSQEKAKQIEAEFEKMFLQLAQEEAKIIAHLIYAYSNDYDRKPEGFPNEWARIIEFLCEEKLDKQRLTGDYGFLDPWGNPYLVRFFEDEGLIEVHSFGPDSKDDTGQGDDIKVRKKIAWPR